ncbi:MAG TPA: L,D-transpeptidase family protein [Dongiaceae bacterium]|nr:L,D-transpeptidase family protein [Dongiaceae bacterium]
MSRGSGRPLAVAALALALAGLLAVDPARATAPIDSDALTKADLVVVRKGERRLDLMRDGTVLDSFPVRLGRVPLGPKQAAGDGRTPEGRYVIDGRLTDSRFYRALRVSYPSPEDIARAHALGVEPGDSVMVHGQVNEWPWVIRYDWTEGCIALSNDDMDAIWQAVDDGTPIIILP